MKLGEQLYELEGFFYFKSSDTKIIEIPKNKFFDGEIVTTNDTHFNKNTFVALTNPHYHLGENSGWYYGMEYIERNGGCGGASSSWKETDFEKLSNPVDILYATRIYNKKEIQQLQSRLKSLIDYTSKIEYALSISVENYDTINRVCHTCGAYFLRGVSGAANHDFCNKCKEPRM